MQDPGNLPELDAIADAVAARLVGRLPLGPGGDPGLPPGALPIPRVPLPDIQVGSRLALAGVEFTQSIQHHGAAGPSYGPDNSVPLVAYKTMVVRAYPHVRRGMFGGDTLSGQRVTGQLTLSIGDRVVYQTGPTRTGGARLGSSSEIDRTLWDQEFTYSGGSSGLASARLVHVNCPLNFVVPAYFCRRGRIHATVRLWPVDDGPMTSRGATFAQYLQFLDVPAPKVCLVRVNWTDSNGNVFKPSDADMLSTLGQASRMMPFPYFETTILGVEENRSGNFAMLAPETGGCNALWSSLVAALNVTRIFTSLFQLGDIVYGFVPQAGIPSGGGKINAGCGRGAGGGFVGLESTFSHELGHLYGRNHVAVNGDDSSDADYPKYGGSARSIGEVGIDTGTSPPTLFDPAGIDDIMSYSNDQWISPYTYQKILDARDMHQSARVDPRRLRSFLVLDIRVHRILRGERRVEVRKAARVAAPGQAPPRPADVVSPVSIDLLDANRQILATHHCAWIPAHGGGHCGCGCGGRSVPLEREPWLDFQEVIELPEEGLAGLAFHDGGEPFAAIDVGEPPRVWIEGPQVRESALLLRVGAEHPRERPSVIVFFSADDGVTWQPVAYDPPNGELAIPTDNLPGGASCMLRAIATAELMSAEADSDRFELVQPPRRLHLDVPSGGCPTPPGPVALAAAVDTRGLGPVAPTEIRWSSSLDGDLGPGYQLAPTLSEGRHELTVTAPDGLGGLLTERAIIIVGGRPRESSWSMG